jgi:hypothetical protein
MFPVGNITSVPGEDHLSSFSDESCPSPMTNQKQSSPPFFLKEKNLGLFTTIALFQWVLRFSLAYYAPPNSQLH